MATRRPGFFLPCLNAAPARQSAAALPLPTFLRRACRGPGSRLRREGGVGLLPLWLVQFAGLPSPSTDPVAEQRLVTLSLFC